MRRAYIRDSDGVSKMTDIECYVNGDLQKHKEVKEEVTIEDTRDQHNGHTQHKSGDISDLQNGHTHYKSGDISDQQNGHTEHSSGYERFPLRRPDNLTTEQRKLSSRVRLEDEEDEEDEKSTAGRRLRPSCPGFPSGDQEHEDGDGEGGEVHAVHVSHRYGASDGDKFNSALSFFKTLEKQS